MTRFQKAWQAWLANNVVDTSDLTHKEQIEFHRQAIATLREKGDGPRFVTMKIHDIPRPNRRLSRTMIDALKESIKKGPITPIVLQRDENGRLRLIDGYHKLVALKELGHTDAPVEIRS